MNLREMCDLVAVYTDRKDDFVTIEDNTGKEVFDPNDDPGIWFAAMKTSINNAYREVARKLMMPDMHQQVTLMQGGEIDLFQMSPDVLQVIAVYNADATAALKFDFINKNRIRVRDGKEKDKVQLQYCYAPDPLESFKDEPVFPEGLVDPMVYICRAAADLWMMERKTQPAQLWETRYYGLLGGIKRDFKSAAMRRIPKKRFR